MLKGGERMKLKGREKKEAREERKTEEYQFHIFLFHQSLLSMDYKTHLNRLMTKP